MPRRYYNRCMRNFFRELRRRNVHRVAIAYLAGSWLLVQILETVYPIYGLDEAGIRTVILALLIGFAPALALSWAFEWAPGGIRSQADIDRDPAATGSSGRTMDRVIIAVLSIAVVYFAVDKFLGEPVTGPGDDRVRSIAVLPFDDMTKDRDQAYFADGLAEELLNLLAQNPSLRVASRTSSFSFRDAALPVEEIARSLNVGHVVEGSIRRDGDRIRVTAQLIDAADGYHVWSQTYDETFSDIFAIQDRMSSQIAAALETTVLGKEAQVRKTDPQAYKLYLQANHLAFQGSADDLERATALYLRALEIDPGYAPGWSQLAAAYVNQAAAGFIDYAEGYRLAREAALGSVRIDPRHAHGYDQPAWVAFWYDADIGAAIDYLRQAIDIAPYDADLLGGAAVLVQALGRPEDAIALLEYSVQRSPVDPVARFNLALAYKYAGNLEAAEKSFRRVLQLSPAYSSCRYHLGETLLLMGRWQDALEVWKSELDEAFRVKGEALAHFALGNRELADAALHELIRRWGEQWPSEVAHVHAWRDEADAAFEWLEKELAAYGAGGWGEWKLQPLYRNLHDDPRWAAFLEGVGASEAQLSQYDLDVVVPAG